MSMDKSQCHQTGPYIKHVHANTSDANDVTVYSLEPLSQKTIGSEAQRWTTVPVTMQKTTTDHQGSVLHLSVTLFTGWGCIPACHGLGVCIPTCNGGA